MDSWPKPIKTWDFGLAHLSSNSDGQGLQWTESGVVLSGPGAYLHLPLELPIGACLTSRSLRFGMRFVNDRVPLTIGLETQEGEQYEKLAFAYQEPGARRGRNAWSLQRSAQPKNATFGTSAPIEQGVNVDIDLALVVDGFQAPNGLYTCYRKSELYGNSARLTGFAPFQGSDGVVLRIEHAGAGRVAFSYAQVFDCALREDQLRPSSGEPLRFASVKEGTEMKRLPPKLLSLGSLSQIGKPLLSRHLQLKASGLTELGLVKVLRESDRSCFTFYL
jgi:hypothetical protein